MAVELCEHFILDLGHCSVQIDVFRGVSDDVEKTPSVATVGLWAAKRKKNTDIRALKLRTASAYLAPKGGKDENEKPIVKPSTCHGSHMHSQNRTHFPIGGLVVLGY